MEATTLATTGDTTKTVVVAITLPVAVSEKVRMVEPSDTGMMFTNDDALAAS